MKIHIKYMVSFRCKLVVIEQLDKLDIDYYEVLLGEVSIKGIITDEQREKLRIGLLKKGLELMDDKKAMLIEKAKTIIIEMVHYSDEPPNTNYSDFISEKLGCSYTYIANLFSDVTGTTIVNFIIAHKIERVKELLLYNELTLTEISYMLQYSSVAHLSNQFKKITGLTPTYFKQMRQFRKRIQLEEVGSFDEIGDEDKNNIL